MRVIFLTHNFPRWPGDLSGAFLATLAAALNERGHQIRVLAPSDAGEVGAPEYDGIPVARIRYADARQEHLAYRGNMQDAIRHPTEWRALVGLWRALRRAAETEAGRGADLIHAHWWVPAGLASPPGTPLVLTVHGTDGALLRRSALARWVATPIFRRAKVVSTVSHRLAADIKTHMHRTVPENHVHPMPMEPSRFAEPGEGGAGAIVVARLTPQKRVHLALEAIALLRQRGLNLPVDIVGDGPERSALEALATRLGIAELVRFEGNLPPADVPDRLRKADVMIFPAEGEGFGLAAVEAYACGVPVVACADGGGILEIVPPTGPGRVVSPDAAAIATAVQEVLGSPGARASAVESGRDWRHRLAPATVAVACERWYHEAVGV